MLTNKEKILLAALKRWGSEKSTRVPWGRYESGTFTLYEVYLNVDNEADRWTELTLIGRMIKDYLETKEYLPEGSILPKLDYNILKVLEQELNVIKD